MNSVKHRMRNANLKCEKPTPNLKIGSRKNPEVAFAFNRRLTKFASPWLRNNSKSILNFRSTPVNERFLSTFHM